MREYGPGHPLVFNHIPKCAGTALRTALIDSLQPSVIAGGIDFSLVGGHGDIRALSSAMRSGFVFSPDDLAADASFVAGHLSPGTTMPRYAGADHITTLRDPRLRVISQWIHGRSLSDFDLRHWGEVGDAFRVGRRPLGEYLRHEMIAPNIDNTITRFLVWPHALLHQTRFIDHRHDEELFAAAVDRLDRFAHVGVIEDTSFMAVLGGWLGRELHENHLNERTVIPRRYRPDMSVELTASTVELLDDRTRIDLRLWTHVASKTLGADPAEVLDASWARAIARYAGTPPSTGRRPVRQTVEALYGLKTRLTSRESKDHSPHGR